MTETAQNQKTLQCPCGARIAYAEESYVFRVAEKTGWTPVYVTDPEKTIIWLCPTCIKMILPKAREIAEIVKNPFFSLSTVFPLSEIKEWEERVKTSQA